MPDSFTPFPCPESFSEIVIGNVLLKHNFFVSWGQIAVVDADQHAKGDVFQMFAHNAPVMIAIDNQYSVGDFLEILIAPVGLRRPNMAYLINKGIVLARGFGQLTIFIPSTRYS
ncbi:hypothetical protein [Citrobacter sp. MNAZ 1397]|uniref:hypothetical protein n=1 Tax=Citrobacter sp. MNAZ 1397 TaxID=2911205 RepID=UPI0020260B4A|nr:hypothetical protein [Citrobacter sp. MNAZ 1397]MCL9671706.1 hypothetical protein [Citrobacter sp. MNAZ 1397]